MGVLTGIVVIIADLEIGATMRATPIIARGCIIYSLPLDGDDFRREGDENHETRSMIDGDIRSEEDDAQDGHQPICDVPQ